MILTSLIAGPQIVLILYIQAWLKDFSTKGVIDDATSDFLYQYQGTAGCLCCFFLLGLVGRLFDTMSIKISLPITVLCRAAVFFAIYSIKNPDTWFFYLIIPVVHVTFFASILLPVSYIAKMFPKDIRGMMNSMVGVFGALTQFIYLTYCDWLFKKSPNL